MADDGEEWLTIGQAHRRLGEMRISEQTVRDWADSGKLSPVRRLASGHRRVAASAVARVLSEWRGSQAD